MSQLRLLTRRYPKVGPLLWILGLLQYFSVQYIVALAWPRPFNLRLNTISDLGNTMCGQQNRLFVCSPLHSLMNISLVIVGLSMCLGVILVLLALQASRLAKVTLVLLGLTGVGTSLIGFFPENIAPLIHYLIAAPSLIIFNSAVFTAYWVPELPYSWRSYSLTLGCLGLLALLMIGIHYPTPLGPGGMERVADYTPDLWVFTLSIYLLIQHKKAFPSP